MLVKVVLGVIVLIVLLAMLGYLYGSSLPEEQSVSRSILIDALPETIYDLAIDAKGQSAWRRDISNITMKEDHQSWVEHKQQGDIEFVLTHQDRPQTFTLDFQGQGFQGKWTGSFVTINSGTEVSLTETVRIKNPFFRLLSKWMRFTEKFMDTYMDDLKIEAEKRRQIKALN